MRFSIDTNVFVYLVDERDLRKQETASDLIERLLGQDTWVGLQVVGELQNVLRLRFAKPVKEAAAAASFVLGSFPSFHYEEADVAYALEELAAGRASYWDALLVSACARVGCGVLFTEDRQGSAVRAGVRIINPFGPDASLSATTRELLDL